MKEKLAIYSHNYLLNNVCFYSKYIVLLNIVMNLGNHGVRELSLRISCPRSKENE